MKAKAAAWDEVLGHSDAPPNLHPVYIAKMFPITQRNLPLELFLQGHDDHLEDDHSKHDHGTDLMMSGFYFVRITLK